MHKGSNAYEKGSYESMLSCISYYNFVNSLNQYSNQFWHEVHTEYKHKQMKPNCLRIKLQFFLNISSLQIFYA